MGPSPMWKLALLALACRRAAHGDSIEEADPPQADLRRVIVVARHGNRAPDPAIYKFCPVFAEEVLPKFGVAPTALSRVGMAENEENGRFLRHRYREFLPPGPYPYDGTYAFFSERMERNIISTQTVARGMFPAGTGIEGFDASNPQLVPIQTTQDGADVLLNCPRDGPCQNALKEDKAKWIAAHEDLFYAAHKDLLRNVSLACGGDISPGGPTSVVMKAKKVMDALGFAKNEGLDYTMGGRLAPATFERFQLVVAAHVHDLNFGKRHQLTYWVGDFLPELLKIARVPLLRPQNKFHLFLNHRELLYTIAHILGMPIDFPGTPKDNFPTASSLILEVYDTGVKLFFWSPSQPSAEAKARYLAEGLPLRELYHRGRFAPTAAFGCAANQICPTEALAASWLALVKFTGTYVGICNVSSEDTYFARGEISLGIVEEWVEPRSPGEDHMEFVDDDEPEEEAELDVPTFFAATAKLGSFWTPLPSTALAAIAAGAVGGLVGHRLGSRSPQVAVMLPTPYVAAPP